MGVWHQQLEPNMVMRETMVAMQFTNMVNDRVTRETKTLLVELEEKPRRKHWSGDLE